MAKTLRNKSLQVAAAEMRRSRDRGVGGGVAWCGVAWFGVAWRGLSLQRSASDVLKSERHCHRPSKGYISVSIQTNARFYFPFKVTVALTTE